MRFSARLAASKGQRAPILEDAPRPTRIGYIKSILGEFVGTQRNTRRPPEQPLDTTETHSAFIALIRDESDPWDYDHESAWAALTTHIKSCEWPEFYDFVELVGKLLQKHDEEIPFIELEDFKKYQTKVNSLLQEDGIGWSLNGRSELTRQLPSSMAKRANATEAMLANKFATARLHYQKAVTYLYQHPIDEANAIKEIVSALESTVKQINPKASTLGNAIKLLRKDPRYSSHLLDALEKMYVYSNATPLVRHGHVEAGGPSLPEAELCLFLCVAYIRYLIEYEKRAS